MSSGIATCPATISRPVRAGHRRGVGGWRSSQGRVLRPGVGAASGAQSVFERSGGSGRAQRPRRFRRRRARDRGGWRHADMVARYGVSVTARRPSGTRYPKTVDLLGTRLCRHRFETRGVATYVRRSGLRRSEGMVGIRHVVIEPAQRPLQVRCAPAPPHAAVAAAASRSDAARGRPTSSGVGLAARTPQQHGSHAMADRDSLRSGCGQPPCPGFRQSIDPHLLHQCASDVTGNQRSSSRSSSFPV